MSLSLVKHCGTSTCGTMHRQKTSASSSLPTCISDFTNPASHTSANHCKSMGALCQFELQPVPVTKLPLISMRFGSLDCILPGFMPCAIPNHGRWGAKSTAWLLPSGTTQAANNRRQVGLGTVNCIHRCCTAERDPSSVSAVSNDGKAQAALLELGKAFCAS